MGGRDQLMAIARRRAARATREFGEALRELRQARGLSRRSLVEGLPISQSKLARWELGQPPHPDLYEAVLVARLLGQDLVARLYPAGDALRDAAHLAVERRFLALLPPHVPRQLEAVIPGPGDLRAWDVLVTLGTVRVGVAVETRLRHVQALLRREQAKMRDSGVQRLLLVLLNSSTNRRAVREAGPALRSELPLDGRTILPALREGRDPGAAGLLFL
jgi:transcriptional regulator with XRE-family HTH domain